MSDPPLSDIDLKNQMALVWTTLKYHGIINNDKLWKTMIIKLRFNSCVQYWLLRDQRKLCEKLEITFGHF